MSNEVLMEAVKNYMARAITGSEMLYTIINDMDDVFLTLNIVDLWKKLSFEITIGNNIWTVMGMTVLEPANIGGDCCSRKKRIRIILQDAPNCEDALRKIVRKALIRAYAYETGVDENKMDLLDSLEKSEELTEWFSKHMDEINASENEIMENISRFMKEKSKAVE